MYIIHHSTIVYYCYGTCISLQDLVISGVFAFLFFCLAIATAVYGGRFGTWESEATDDRNIDDLDDAADLNEDMGAVSVSSSHMLCT